MLFASSKVLPSLFVFLVISLPARSTKLIFPCLFKQLSVLRNIVNKVNGVTIFLLGKPCSKLFLSDRENFLQCLVIHFWTIPKLCSTLWYRLLCCHHLKLSLRCKIWCEFECLNKVILSHLCMWTVSMVWLRLLCSFMLWVPIARFFKPSSSTANKSSSSAHSMLFNNCNLEQMDNKHP